MACHFVELAEEKGCLTFDDLEAVLVSRIANRASPRFFALKIDNHQPPECQINGSEPSNMWRAESNRRMTASLNLDGVADRSNHERRERGNSNGALGSISCG